MPEETVFDESEVEPIVGGLSPYGRVIVFDEAEVDVIEAEPLVFPRPYEVMFDDTEAERILHEPSGPHEETPAPPRTVDFDPVVITGVRPRTGPVPPQHTAGLTDPHRRLLGKQVIEADPIEPWGVREAGRAYVESEPIEGSSRQLRDRTENDAGAVADRPG